MTRKIILGFVASLFVFEVGSYIVDGFLLASTYESLKELWRPDMMDKLWIFQLVMIISAFFFAFIFSKGYEGKGILEGVRYGLYIGVWLGVGKAYATYAMIAIPYSMAITWFIAGLVQYTIAGIVLAMVFGRKQAVPAA